MSYIDARGAQVDFDVAASVGLSVTVTVTDEGVERDLAGITISAVLKDDREQARDYGGEHGSETTIGMTIDDDPETGIFTLAIPAENFRNKEGGRMSYECYQDEDGTRTGLLWGYITVQERG